MNEKEVFKRIKDLDLYRHERFDELTEDQFCEIYNGYGPDSWSDTLRGIISWIYRNFPELAGVHDVGFYFSDGTLAGWRKTLTRWINNIDIVLDDVYPLRKFWLYPFRRFAFKKLMLAYRLLEIGSFKFYVESKLGTD